MQLKKVVHVISMDIFARRAHRNMAQNRRTRIEASHPISLVCLLAILVSAGSCHVPSQDGEDSYQEFHSQLDRHVAGDEDQYRYYPERCDHFKPNDKCILQVSRRSATYYGNLVQAMDANFAKFTINFVGMNNSRFTLNQTNDAILPENWVWTYFIPRGFFPYLKWPLDFQVLSLNLLKAKTLPVKTDKIIMDIQVQGNCSLNLGSERTTCQLGAAFKNLTQKYLVPIHEREFGYSYWCYTKEVPRIKQTLAYKLAIHIGSPVEFSRYNCCRTNQKIFNKSQLEYRCIDQVPRMFRISLIPYIIAIIAFAYFPILLFTIFGQNIHVDNVAESTHNGYTELEDSDHDWVFLDGHTPINFTSLVGGLCGLEIRHPHATSRYRRAIFLFIIPLLVYLQIYIYWMFMYETVVAYLEHGGPLQFVSLIGGVEKSMENFAPMFGGPPCLLAVYYIAGLVFLVLPRNVNTLVDKGCALDSRIKEFSPLIYKKQMLVKFSGIRISEYFGYSKAAAIFRAGIYMLANAKFWVMAIAMQTQRVRWLFAHVQGRSFPLKLLLLVLFSIFLPLYIGVCIGELVFCILFYGLPVFSCIYIMAQSYWIWLKTFFDKGPFSEVSRVSELIGAVVIKVVIGLISACMFVYFVVSISAIIIISFNFLCDVIVTCFIAVVVYPLLTFGYVFFVVIIVYYIFKQLDKFGHSYFELLSMAVDISIRMEDDIYQARIENDVIVINKTNGAQISKLRIHDQIVNLSTELRHQIQTIPCPQHRRIAYRNKMAGIPHELFDHVVSYFRPVHVAVFHALLRVVLIAVLVGGTYSLVVVKPFGPQEGIAEVLHVMFVVVIGALPKILEISLGNADHLVKDDIQRTKMKTLIVDFWAQKDAVIKPSHA